MKRIVSFIFVFLLMGCVTIQGTIKSGVYRSSTGSFETLIPYPSNNLHISDGVDSDGEMVRFDVEYSYHHRIERFIVNAHPISTISDDKSGENALSEIESSLFHYLDEIGVKSLNAISNKTKVIQDQLVSISVREISYKDTVQVRGVLIFLTKNYVNILHFSHPMFTKEDAMRIENELERFYGKIIIIKT